MDPYFNINNSGASNLTLGSNEVQEVTITTNPYSGQYGQLSGAQVSYVTKSGTNQIHSNAPSAAPSSRTERSSSSTTKGSISCSRSPM
jgi:hypothetical protein